MEHPDTKTDRFLDRLNRWVAAKPILAGMACGTVAAVLYTLANTCLLSVKEYDPMWVSCLKAIPIVLLIGPWLLVIARQGKRVFPTKPILIALLLAATAEQFLGNTLFQWSLGILGISLTIPIMLGAIIIVSALLGSFFLREKISGSSVVAIGVLVLAVAMLGWAAVWVAHQAGSPGGGDAPSGYAVMVGVIAVLFAACNFATLGIVIRYSVTRGTPLSTTVVICGCVGTIGLGLTTYFRLGLEAMLQIAPQDMGLMLLAGICNAIAFLSLTKAFQLTSAVHVNIFSATQSAMAAVIGVVLFAEPSSWAMVVGVVLTILGLLLVREAPSCCDSIRSEPL